MAGRTNDAGDVDHLSGGVMRRDTTPVPGPDSLPPVHVARSATFQLPTSLAATLPLFSPEGERAWVPGWDPEYLHPRSGATTPGTIFRTRHNGEEILWLILRYDLDLGCAEYARITPGSRMGTVRIQAKPVDPDHTTVTVTYELTGLTEAGNRALEGMTAQAFAAMIANWQRAIISSLSSTAT